MNYDEITPLMSLPTFIIGFISILLIASLAIELYDIIKARKTRQRQTSKAFTANAAVQRYYNMRNANNHTNQKGA